MPQPKTFLIQILVTVAADGSLTTQYRSLYNPKVVANPLTVNVGDHVGWLVQVVIASDRKLLPYTVDLSKNPTFFGRSSVSVPAGGMSGFQPVLALQDKVKYSVVIPGLTTLDPDIQSGGDSGSLGHGTLRAPVAYSVYWDTAHPGYRMKYSVGGGSKTDLPLTVAYGDTITFNALVTGHPTVAKFFVAFSGNGWASPFDANQGRFPANGANTTIGPKQVNDPEDPGASFPFVASITLDGRTVTSDANDQNNAIVMAKPQPEAVDPDDAMSGESQE